MNNRYKEIANLDRLVHDPSRLAILSVLSARERADFTYLLNVTGLTKGNLSSHIAKLEDGKLVTVQKIFKLKKPVTFVKLTKSGKNAIDKHWSKLESFRRNPN